MKIFFTFSKVQLSDIEAPVNFLCPFRGNGENCLIPSKALTAVLAWF